MSQILSGLMAFLLWILSVFNPIVGLIAEQFEPEESGVAPVSEHCFAFTEAVYRYQGIATDGESWYYSWNFGLLKTDLNHKVTAQNTVAIPDEYFFQGSNHIGGIAVYGNKLYAPLEDGSDYLHTRVLIYDAETLRYTGENYELARDLHVGGVPWIAVDGANDRAYTAEWSNASVLNVYRLSDFTLLETLPLSAPIDRVQGAQFYDGTLYCATDIKDSHAVLAVNPETGEVKTVLLRRLDNSCEAEGIAVWPMADGSFFHCVETGASRVIVKLRHYAIPD
ncbi:MAG: hypothetical protein LBB67_00535 [Oscillospiraceae bacterium]|nr:hypothetical protein [Oscillospiraceae bacterium]